MIMTRTPYRISFFGGGTDYPIWYRQNKGAVLATTIDKYCYISCRYLPPFFEHKSRIVYSKIEDVKNHDEIQHPAVREVLKYMEIQEGVEIHHDGDLPARTGLGSSSSFTVGLLHCLFALKQKMPSKIQLALEAIRVERDLLKENVGSQDQVSAAFGGFNRITFERDDNVHLQPIIIERGRLDQFQDHLMLYFTGFSRFASEIAAEQIKNTAQKKSELNSIYGMVEESISILTSEQDLSDFGRLLHESWLLKRSLSSKISTPETNQIYEAALDAGALGGKLLGAGGGGFMLLFVRPEDQPKVRERLRALLNVPFRFETSGSQIAFYDPNTFERDGHLIRTCVRADQNAEKPWR
jgi:D-glycero-alpha-D-manno-heptose-7-phosphate kinase